MIAVAQVPFARMMPDGSNDAYIGLGVASVPEYEGAAEQGTRVIPAVQMQWSNGLFWNGASAGWHLSDRPDMEFGPLLDIYSARSTPAPSSLDAGSDTSVAVNVPPSYSVSYSVKANGIGARAEAGGFFNYYLSTQTRLNNSILYGSGKNHTGARLLIDLQHTLPKLTPHHTASVLVGATWVNRAFMRSYFDATQITDEYSGKTLLTELTGPTSWKARSGVKDLHLGLHWNWAVDNAWLLASQVSDTHLVGNAANSPVANRRDNIMVGTALAYRF